VNLVRKMTSNLDGIYVDSFNGLIVDCAKSVNGAWELNPRLQSVSVPAPVCSSYPAYFLRVSIHNYSRFLSPWFASVLRF
jgi:hypothetical protein